jgi:tetratricopeptide (TPR) repeat protein
MLKQSNILILLFLFVWSCSVSKTSIETIADSPADISKDIITEETQDPSGIQFFMDGMMFMEQGEYSRAIIEFQEAIERGSNSAEVYHSISEGYWMIQKYDKSIYYALKAIEKDSISRDYKISLGKKYIALNELNLSLEIFENLANNEDDNADILFIIGDLKSELRDIDGALVYYQEAYDKDNTLILALEVAAQLAIESKHRDAALIVKKLLLSNPVNPEYLKLYIESIEEGNHLSEIESLLDNKEIKSNPFINNLYNQLAYEYLISGYYDKSEEFFEKSLEMNDKDRFALYYLSTLYRESAKFDQSIQLSEQHIRLYPNDKEGYINKSLSLLNLQRFNLAKDQLSEALELFPEDFQINYFLGLAHYSLQEFENAEIFYKKALSIDTNSIAAMHALAMAYDQNKKWEESDQLYTELIALNINDAQAYNNYAYSLIERNEDVDYALTLAKKAIELSPKTSSYLDTIGWIYFKLNDLEKAKEFIGEAIVYDESSSVILEHYGDVLIKLDEIDEALIFYNKALDLDKENTDLIEKISNYSSRVPNE